MELLLWAILKIEIWNNLICIKAIDHSGSFVLVNNSMSVKALSSGAVMERVENILSLRFLSFSVLHLPGHPVCLWSCCWYLGIYSQRPGEGDMHSHIHYRKRNAFSITGTYRFKDNSTHRSFSRLYFTRINSSSQETHWFTAILFSPFRFLKTWSASMTLCMTGAFRRPPVIRKRLQLLYWRSSMRLWVHLTWNRFHAPH